MSIRPAEQIIHKAAWLYYAHGMRQDQVAKELNISRASVAMYLRKARDTGIVNISTSTQLFTDDVLARQVEDALKLDAVWIAPQGWPDVGGAGVGSQRISRTCRQGRPHRRCLGQNRLHHRRRHVLCRSAGCHRGAAVRQSRRSLLLPARPMHHGHCPPAECRGINFYAPLVLSTEELARELRAEPVIREQLASIPECDLVALFGRHGRCRKPRRQMRRT